MNIAVAGYGALGRSVIKEIEKSEDLELACVFTHRPCAVRKDVKNVGVYAFEDAPRCKADAVINCGGSSSELPLSTPLLAEYFNVVDSYDNHGLFEKHLKTVGIAAEKGGHTAIIGAGWDPGIFSLARMYFGTVFSGCNISTFWGRGISRGHSEAIRRIDGVIDAVEYTVPDENAVKEAMKGKKIKDIKSMHIRECYAVIEKDADKARIASEIASMPEYFEGYRTKIFFVEAGELAGIKSEHHAGQLTVRGNCGENAGFQADMYLKLGSNVSFTASVMCAYCRAAVKMAQMHYCGCKTVADVPLSFLMLSENPFSAKGFM